MHGSARSYGNVHAGGWSGVSHSSSHLGFIVSLALALGLLAISAGAVVLVRDRAAQSPAQAPAQSAVLPATQAQPDVARIAATGASVELSSPRVPSYPVATLDRIDISTMVRNSGDREVSKVALELNVRQPDGTSVMTARQSGLSLEAHDSRAVYWSWRVPARLGGSYTVEVHAFDADGQPLDGSVQSTPLFIAPRSP